MKTLLSIITLSISLYSYTQSWCSEEFNPAINLQDNTKSPDYNKEYTVYLYYELKAPSTVFFTPIYEVTFTNYDNDKLLINKVFAEQLKNETRKFLAENHPNVFLGYALKNPSYCLSLDDVKSNYQKNLSRLKERNKKVIMTGDIKPEESSYTKISGGKKTFKIPFKLVQ